MERLFVKIQPRRRKEVREDVWTSELSWGTRKQWECVTLLYMDNCPVKIFLQVKIFLSFWQKTIIFPSARASCCFVAVGNMSCYLWIALESHFSFWFLKASRGVYHSEGFNEDNGEIKQFLWQHLVLRGLKRSVQAFLYKVLCTHPKYIVVPNISLKVVKLMQIETDWCSPRPSSFCE